MLIRVGDSVFNLSNANQIVLRGDGSVALFLIGEHREGFPIETVVLGAEARALREWLLDIDNVEYVKGSGGSW